MNMNPNSAQDRASNPHPALGLAFRVDQIITALRHLINARAPLLGIFFMPLHHRLGRSLRRLTTLLTRLATGQYPAPRPARPSQHSGPPPIQLPRSHAWIVAKLGYQAAAYASHLEPLLRDPDMLQLLAAAPPNAQAAAARTLRPLCRMLGVPLPPILQPPPTPKKPAPPKPPRAPRPPRLTARDLYPWRTPRPTPFLPPAPPRKIPKTRPT